jgi:hypothetical protein
VRTCFWCCSNIKVCYHFVTITKTWDNQLLKKKDLLWFTVLEVPVHDWLACCFGKAAHHGSSVRQNKTVHLITRKQKKEEGAGVAKSPSSIYCQWPKDLLQAPKRATLWTGPLTHGPLGDMWDPNHSTRCQWIWCVARAHFSGLQMVGFSCIFTWKKTGMRRHVFIVSFLYFILFNFIVLGMVLRTLHKLGKCYTSGLHPQVTSLLKRY